MNGTSKSLSIIAYYLSKYDMEAVKRIGYSNRTNAMSTISSLMGRDNNYLKLRRDEFDVLTGSHRRGWINRPATNTVIELYEYLEQFSFDEITNIVKALLEGINQTDDSTNALEIETAFNEVITCDEEEFERLINLEDNNASVYFTNATISRRRYSKNIILRLKELYQYKCQICLYQSFEKYGKASIEAHHINYFFTSHNNNASNIVILCPNHHRIIHTTNPNFNRESLAFEFPNGYKENLAIDHHLQ